MRPIPRYRMIAEEQDVTIEGALVIVPLVDGYVLPDNLPSNWTVLVNGKSGWYNSSANPVRYIIPVDIDDHSYTAEVGESLDLSDNNKKITLTVIDENNYGAVIPGTYTIEIKQRVNIVAPEQTVTVDTYDVEEERYYGAIEFDEKYNYAGYTPNNLIIIVDGMTLFYDGDGMYAGFTENKDYLVYYNSGIGKYILCIEDDEQGWVAGVATVEILEPYYGEIDNNA